MNDVQKFVNGILRNHSMHKRYIAVLTALSMVVSIVVTSILVMPADSKAGSLICEKTEHIHDESCKKLVCGLDEVIYDEVTTEAVSQAIGQFVQLAQLEDETVGDAKTEASVEVTESSEVVEGTESIIEATEETVDSESASESAGEISEDTNEDTVPQVTESVQHIHTDECYMYVCGFEEHTHSEDCYESVEVDPTPDEVDSYMINQNAFDVFNVFGRPMHLLYNDVSATGEFSTENNPDSTMPVNPGAILGVATHFHVLAEEASFESHVHGNVATNYLVKCGAFGVYLNKLAGKSSVNYIRNFGEYAPLNNAFQTKLVLGSRYAVEQIENDNRYRVYEKENPSNEFYIPIGNFPEGKSMNENVEINDNYINVTKELDKFADMSRAIAAKPSKGTVFSSDSNPVDMNTVSDQVVITDNGTELYTLDFSKITDKYIYYTLDLTGNDKNGQPLINFSTCSKVLEIKGITKDKFLFLTVDVGSNTDVAFNKSWKVYRADDQSKVYDTGEVPLDDGSCRVIYNIVNSTTSNGVREYTPFGENSEGQPTDSKIILGEQKNGTFLVPRGYVNCAGNTNGTIIAYKYVASGESHRADIQFEDEEVDDVDCPTTSENVTSSEDEGGESTTPEEKKISITVNKVWSDGNDNHQSENVEIQLYKAYESRLDITDNSLIGNKLTLVSGTNQITLNQSNNWTAKFEGLPIKDKIDEQTEKLIYYYIKEVNKEGYTTTYSANGLNSVDRTVTVRNSKKMSITVEKQWYKSDNTAIDFVTEIKFKLYKSKVKVDTNIPTEDSRTLVGEYILNSSNPRYKIENLESEENGQPLYYYIEEVNPSSEYNVTYENNAYNVNSSGNMIIKNTKKAEDTISITVTKHWNASDYSGVVDYVSPVRQYNIPVKVMLQKKTQSTNWVNVNDTYVEFTTSYTFTNLPKTENGSDLYYRVVEGFVYGYKAVYSNNYIDANRITGDNQVKYIDITNNLINKNLTINKSWHNNMSDGVNSIVIEVYRKLAGDNPDIKGDEVEDVSSSQPQEPENPDNDNGNETGGGSEGGSTGGGSQGGETGDTGSVTVSGNVLTVVPEDGSFSYNGPSAKSWRYVIPNNYYGKTVKSIKIVCDENGTYNVTIRITANNSNGEFQWHEYYKDQAGNTNSVMQYDISEGFYLDTSKANSYGIYLAGYDGNNGTVTKLEITFTESIEGLAVTGVKTASFIRNNWLLFATVNYNSELTISNINDSLSNTTFSYDGLTGTYPAYKVTISESDSNTSKYYGNTLTSLLASCQANSGSSCEVAVLLLKNNTVVEWIHTMVSSSDSKFTFKNGGCYIETGNTYDIYVFKYSETENSNFRINNATCNFSTGNTTTDGEDEYTTGNTTHNFTTNGTLSSFYTISGELSTNKDTQYYNGLTLTQCLKINSNASINFSVSENHTGKLILVFGNSKGESFYIDNTLYTVDDDGVLEIDNLSAGSHTIKQNSGNEPDLFYMTYSETVVENQKKDEVSFVNNVLTVIPANAKGEENKYSQNNGYYFKNAWGYQIPSEHRGKTITNIKVTFGSNVNGAEVCILPNKNQSVTEAYWEGDIYAVPNTNNSSSLEWNNVSYTIPTTYTNYSLYVIEVGDVNNNTNFQDYIIAKLEITFASENIISGSKDVYVDNIKNEEMTLNGSEQIYLVSWESDMADYKDKLLSEIQVTYNYLNEFPNYQTHTNLWLQGADDSGVGNIGRSTSNNIAIWKFNNLKLSSLHKYFLRIATTQSQILSKIVIKFTDGSEYTLWNKCYGVNDTNNRNESADVDIYNKDYNSEGTYDNYSVISVSDKLNNYLNKYLDEVKVYLKDSSTDSSKVSVYMHQKYSWDTLSQISKNYDSGNAVITYNYGGISVHNLRDQFFRMQTEVNTEIQKVVLVFSDNSTFTMNNKSYVASTTPSTKLEQSKEVEIKKDTDHTDLITKSDLSDYTGRKITKLETYYTSANDVNLTTTKIYLRNTSGNDSGNNGQGTNNNIGYFNYNSRDLSEFDTNLLYINTSVNEKIEKIVFTFDGGTSYESTYTLINKSYEYFDKPEEPKQVHYERDITVNKSLYGTTLHEKYGYWVDSSGNPNDNHEGFGFYNEHKNAYANKYFNSVQVYYRDMLLGFPDYQKDTKVYLLRHSEINGGWCPDQTGYDFEENIATWYYGNDGGEIASNLGEQFFWIKTSRPDEISKIVINFTDGSTYTMNNTAYVASSKVESSEDDYTYNTGEYVLIAKITLTADRGWRHTLDNLPATDGQGNAYTYHIKETNIYGSDADKYKVLSYTNEDGIVLENDSNDIGVTNERKADENINVLPNTGSTGTKGYFVAGIIVMICSAAGYTVIKRRFIY